MSTTKQCPTTEKWTQYLHGRFAEAEESNLTAHLDGCESCQKVLETLSGSDSILEVAKKIGEECEAGKMPGPHAASQATEAYSQASHAPAKGDPGDTIDGDDIAHLLTPSDRPDSIGKLDHYEIFEIVGKGGFGTVFRAFDTKLHRVVAIKIMAPELAVGATARKRFIREAQAAAAVRDDHVIAIFAVEDEHQPPYLAMEYVDGVSLQQKLDRDGPPELKEILRIGAQTARGLASAHKQGLVHRDIKPSNILLENGVERVKISDFGLARAVDDASITQSGVIAGTPMYMSPEQANGESIDHRSDLFSLGSVLYAMCTGHSPFRASGTMAVLKRVMEDTPRSIPEVNQEIPPWLCNIIAKLHAKKPEERFQSAEEVANLLEQHLAHLQHPSKTPMPAAVQVPTEPAKSARKPRRRLWKAAVILLAIGLGGWWLGPSLWNFAWNQSELGIETNAGLTKLIIRRDGKLVHTLSPPFGQFKLPPGTYELEAICNSGKRVEKIQVNRRHLVLFEGYSQQMPDGRITLRLKRGESFSLQLNVIDEVQIASKDGWVQLFNGKNLDKWSAFGPIKWKAVNGEMLLEGNERGAGEWLDDISRLQYSTPFQDFHLRAEVKFSGNPGARGILRFRDAGQTGPYAFVQIGNYGEPGEPGRTDERTGSLGVFAKQEETWPVVVSKNLVPPDKWFTLEIIARRQQVTVKVNGTQTAQATLKEIYLKGFLTLEAYLPKTVIHFRKIEIKGLPFEPEEEWVQLFNGKDLTGWKKRGAQGSWAVIDNVLTGVVARGKVSVLDSLSPPCADFHLRARVRLGSKMGHGGIFFRSGDKAGYQVEIDPKMAGNLTARLPFKFDGKHLGGEVHTLVAFDAWFDLEVIASGPRITTKINGQTVAQITDATSARGGIALEVDGLQGAMILDFKKIEIKELPPTPVDDQWVQLFNGKDLTGWHPIWPGAGKWEVKDGELIGKGAKIGRLVSDRGDFTDFHFRAQVKVNGSANAGVFFRGTGQPIRGYEAQINVNSKEDQFRTGSLRRCTDDPKRRKWLTSIGQSPVPADEWFTLEVIAQGEHLQVLVNGKKTSDVHDDTFTKGYFALEFFGESSVVQFKKIEVKALTASAPFVILAKNGMGEQTFDALIEAVNSAQSGDTIEIRGNGPFVSDTVDITKALTIRAGKGYEPVLRLSKYALDKKAKQLHATAPLTLEGLHLHILGAPDFKGNNSLYAVRSEGAPLRVANCRFVLFREQGPTEGMSAISVHYCPWLEVRNCQELNGGFVSLGHIPDNAQTIITNCLATGVHPITINHSSPKARNVSMAVRNNIFDWNFTFNLYERPAGKDLAKVKKVFRIDVTNNIFRGPFQFDQTGPWWKKNGWLTEKEATKALRELVDWRESKNLHSVPPSSGFLMLSKDYRVVSVSQQKLAEWQSFWKLPILDAIQVGGLKGVFKDDDWLSKKKSAPEQLTPDDFRLSPTSPAKGAGKDGGDIGANVDLVGPGMAYERWKKMPEYQIWRKKSAALMERPLPRVPKGAALLMSFEKEHFYQKDGKTYVRDLSGRGNDALCAGVKFTAQGKTGAGLANDGSGHLQLPKSLIANQSDFTIAAWMRLERIPKLGVQFYSVKPKGEPDSKSSNFHVICQPGAHIYSAAWNEDYKPNMWAHADTDAELFQAGEWFFIAVRLENGAAGKGRYRITVNDRTLERNLQMMKNSQAKQFMDVLFYKAPGVLDEIGVWSRALSDEEIGQIRKMAARLNEAKAKQPFVILGKNGAAQESFATLKDTVNAAKSGDTIEIHGNGAFVTDTVKITKPLTIRAAKGYEPILQMSKDAAEKERALFYATAPLTLEGLHLHIRNAPVFVAGKNSRYAIRCEGAPLRIANCRFVLSREDGPAFGMSAISVHHCPFLEVVNCHNLVGGFVGVGDMPDNSQMTISNCISTGSRPLTINHNLPRAKNISLNLRNNFFHERLTFNLYQKPAGDDLTKLKNVFRIDAGENILRGAFDVSQSGTWWQQNGWLTPVEAANVFRGLVDWHESTNVYVIRPDSGFLALTQNYKFVAASLKTPAQWQAFWKLPKLNAIKVDDNKGVFKDDAWMKKMKSAPEQLTPDDFRLSPTSPAIGAGKGGSDLGPNAGLVGPGAAYERWQKTRDYQEWRIKTAKLLPDKQ